MICPQCKKNMKMVIGYPLTEDIVCEDYVCEECSIDMRLWYYKRWEE